MDEDSALFLDHCLGAEFHVVGGGVSSVDGAVDGVEKRGGEGGVFFSVGV